MLNLSQIARETNFYPLSDKIRSILNPDIYLAENLADYMDNTKSLKFSWYKRFPIFDKSMDEAYIIFQNVGLRRLVQGDNWFWLHDSSGEELVYWSANDKLFPTIASFEEMQEKQCLKDNDWVYDVFVRYLIKEGFPSIVEVNKYNNSGRNAEKDSLAERIRTFFPDFGKDLQPAF